MLDLQGRCLLVSASSATHYHTQHNTSTTEEHQMARRAKGKGYLKKEGKEGFWYGYLRNGKKVIRIKLSQNEREARRMWDEWLAENASKKPVVGNPLDSVWAKVKEELDAQGQSESRIKNCKKTWTELRAILEERGAKDLSEVTVSDITKFFKTTKGGDATRNNKLVFLRKILNACLPDLPRSENPLRHFKTIHGEQAHRQPLSNEEIAAVRKAAIDAGREDIDGIIVLSLRTGLRAKDCALLKTSQYRNGCIVVNPHKTRHSSGADVEIPVGPELAEVLLKAKPKNGYFFPNLASTYNRSQSSFATELRHIWDKAKKNCPSLVATEKAAGGRMVSVKGFHALRATFGSRLAEENVGNGTIQSMMGHIGPAQTQAYLHPGLDAKTTAIAALEASYKREEEGGDARFDQIKGFFSEAARKALEALKRKMEEEKAGAERTEAREIVESVLPDIRVFDWNWDAIPPPPDATV